MALGERLREVRERRGWSQHELARRSGVRQALISALETGKQTDTAASVLRRLARTLGVSMDYLVGTFDPNRSPAGQPSVDGATVLPVAHLLCKETVHAQSTTSS
jgi:transcriptional regulator with XRE-family HTH domain